MQAGSRACRVPLIEDQVEDTEDGPKACREVLGGWKLEPPIRMGDALLGPGDALRHGGLRDEEGTGDLLGGEASKGPQRKGDLSRQRERRMTTHEQQG